MTTRPDNPREDTSAGDTAGPAHDPGKPGDPRPDPGAPASDPGVRPAGPHPGGSPGKKEGGAGTP